MLISLSYEPPQPNLMRDADVVSGFVAPGPSRRLGRVGCGYNIRKRAAESAYVPKDTIIPRVLLCHLCLRLGWVAKFGDEHQLVRKELAIVSPGESVVVGGHAALGLPVAVNADPIGAGSGQRGFGQELFHAGAHTADGRARRQPGEAVFFVRPLFAVERHYVVEPTAKFPAVVP